MAIDFDGKEIETTQMGYLVNAEDWSEGLAKHIASSEGLELTSKHWDVINHLRDEFFNNAGNQPNTRKLVKYFEKLWGEKIDAKVLYDLFPGDPSKQGGRISGLPESRRKGGY
ncbi:MAG: TusE/DsrC/DsvC family sulfur relay protein [Pseudomonadota bacterium]|nr:TusE/DsrC/DsvC family sulfur relay protein [Pseudomonadota bacterium]|tara:strand:+ start:643 stop:981 length:339 start_codon:yes stop_codon:yes gene_type:complete